MKIETLASFVEALLDASGIYGACSTDYSGGECRGVCRSCMSAELRSRVRDACIAEEQLMRGGIPGDYLSRDAIEAAKAKGE